MKSTLGRLQKEKNEIRNAIASIIYDSDDDTSVTSVTRPQRNQATGTVLLPKECLFCKKDKRTKSKTRESLSLCIDLRAENSIKSAAKKKGDFVLLGIPDLIAAEAYYHKSCYKQYLKVNYETERESSTYKEAEKAAYKNVVSFCVELHLNPDVVPLSFLINMMQNVFTEMNEEISNSVKKNLRRKIQKDVKTVRFIKVDGISYIYPVNIKTEDVISMFVKVRNELKSMKERYEEQTVDEENLVKSMKLVKREIKDLDDKMPWPPQPSDLQSRTKYMAKMLNSSKKNRTTSE